MEYRFLEINITKALDLKNVNLFTTMDVYAVVSISGDPRRISERQRTPLAKHSGSNPHWNHHPMKFTIHESATLSNRLNLEIKFVSKSIFGDRKIGKVIVPIKQLIDENAGVDQGKRERIVSFSVRTSSGNAKGNVEFSYKFGEKYTVQAPPPLSPPLSPPPLAPPFLSLPLSPPLTAYHEGYDRSSSGFAAAAGLGF